MGRRADGEQIDISYKTPRQIVDHDESRLHAGVDEYYRLGQCGRTNCCICLRIHGFSLFQ